MLYAILTDPDHSSAHTETLKAEFKIYWTPSGGTQQTRYYTTGGRASGTRFSYDTTPLNLPQNVVIAWEVRASDGTAWGQWSSAGDQTRCEFIFDKTAPPAPDIDSPEYLPNDVGETSSVCAVDEEWRGSVGVYGTFTCDSAGTDAVKYEYGFNGDPSPNNVLVPSAPGGLVGVYDPVKGSIQLYVNGKA